MEWQAILNIHFSNIEWIRRRSNYLASNRAAQLRCMAPLAKTGRWEGINARIIAKSQIDPDLGQSVRNDLRATYMVLSVLYSSLVILFIYGAIDKKSWTDEKAALLSAQNGRTPSEVPMISLPSLFATHSVIIWIRLRRIRQPFSLFLIVTVFPAVALAQSSGSPFDTGFTALQNLFTGTIAKVASLIAIVIGGNQFAHGEPGGRQVSAAVYRGSGRASWKCAGSSGCAADRAARVRHDEARTNRAASGCWRGPDPE